MQNLLHQAVGIFGNTFPYERGNFIFDPFFKISRFLNRLPFFHQVSRKGIKADEVADIGDHQTFQGVFQFPHISRPRIALQGVHRFGGQRFVTDCHFPGSSLEEMFHQQRQVFDTLSQGRNGQRENIEAVIEIRSKLFLLHQLLEVTMSRGNHTHVGGQQFLSPNSLKLTFLQNPKQFGLEFERHVSNFIQKKCPVSSLFKFSSFAFNRAGEGSFFMTEQFRFKQFRRNGRTVDRHKRTLGTI